MNTVSHLSMVSCSVVYLLCGTFGYLTFRGVTQSDLLNNFQVQGSRVATAVDVVRSGFGISLIFSYPVVVWEARHNLSLLLFGSASLGPRQNFGQ